MKLSECKNHIRGIIEIIGDQTTGSCGQYVKTFSKYVKTFFKYVLMFSENVLMYPTVASLIVNQDTSLICIFLKTHFCPEKYSASVSKILICIRTTQLMHIFNS